MYKYCYQCDREIKMGPDQYQCPLCKGYELEELDDYVETKYAHHKKLHLEE